MISIEILQLVDELEAVLNAGWRIPLTTSLIVNEEDCLRLIDQMRVSVPDAIKQAQRTLAERDRILAQAREEAAQIVANAHNQVDDLVNQHELVIVARERAAEIEAESRRRSAEMTAEANAYVLSVLQQLEAQLEATLRQVRNGIQTLQPELAEESPKAAQVAGASASHNPVDS